mmetsp:Transcript_3798/g.6648  ORF Transcript_3798/g.6648 Transcript_3798/m.6648 type:complete len:206 (+) Transcript_3798:101-718(+)
MAVYFVGLYSAGLEIPRYSAEINSFCSTTAFKNSLIGFVSFRRTNTSSSRLITCMAKKPPAIWEVNEDLGGADEEEEVGWESEDDPIIAPDDTFADVELRRSVQDELWRMPKGSIHMSIGDLGVKASHYRRLRMLLREKKIVTVEVRSNAPVEKYLAQLRGDRDDPHNLARVLGTLSLPNKHVLLFGERDFVSTLTVDPYAIVDL